VHGHPGGQAVNSGRDSSIPLVTVSLAMVAPLVDQLQTHMVWHFDAFVNPVLG
jgi:hypothetical protein